MSNTESTSGVSRPARTRSAIGVELGVVAHRRAHDVHWFQNSRRTSVCTIGPDVAPHVTSRPRLPSASSDCAHVASPTVSIDDIDAALAGARADLLADIRRAWLIRFSAPSPRARASFSSLRDVTHASRRSACTICSAASATPPPMPQISTLSPLRTRARVTTMRHAVSVASVNAAACSTGLSVGIARTLRAGTTMYSASVPGQVLAEEPERDAERTARRPGSTRRCGR